MNTKIGVGICIFFFSLTFCHKEHYTDYTSSGIITGPDIRACACCGGWFIQIDSTTYEFDTLPDSSDINLEKETFPVYVKLDWQFPGTGYCPANKIIILRIKKNNL
jgi:hypothetical protein